MRPAKNFFEGANEENFRTYQRKLPNLEENCV